MAGGFAQVLAECVPLAQTWGLACEPWQPGSRAQRPLVQGIPESCHGNITLPLSRSSSILTIIYECHFAFIN